jgi:hypothetical protein
VKKGTIVLLVLAAVWLVILGAPSQGAAQYLGQSTWTVSVTQNEHGTVSESATMTGAVPHVGGAYYTMQGYANVHGDGPFILSGGGVLIGETLYLNLATAQLHTDNDWRDTGVMHVQLDKTTLNGTFYEVGHDFKLSSAGPSPSFDTRFTAVTLTLTGARIVLSSNLAGPTSLLLDDSKP